MMTNKEMFYFTGKCLALDDHPEFRLEIINNCLNDYIDWQQFIMLCSNHLILPAIYLKFRKYRLLKYLPEDVSNHLSKIFDLNVSRNTNIHKQLQEITDTLNRNNIYPLFLKGAAHILDDVYSNIGERMMGDIDFLVDEEDYLTAARIMENEGYIKVTETPAYKDIRYFKHYPRLVHPDFEAVIEIHRIPVHEKYLAWFNSNILESEKKTITSINGCFVPSDHHKIVHNFIHSQLANRGNLSGIISLKDIFDLYLLSKRYSLKKTRNKALLKRKGYAYFALAYSILGLDGSFFSKKNFTFKKISTKHNLYFNSSVYRYFLNIFLFLEERQYIAQLTKALFSKRMRKSVIMRIGNKKWYADHLRLYANYRKGSY